MSIFSDIEIQSGGTLDISGATINIISGGHIRVKNGGYLIVSSSTLSNACYSMWGGIYTENGGRVVVSKSLIENAEIGLEIEPYTDTQIEKTVFDKNYIGIYTKPQSTPTIFLSFYLNDVTFSCTGSLIPNTKTTATKTFAGIYFNNTNAVIEGAIDKLIFTGINNGICLIESNVDVKNSYFEKIQPDVTYGNFYDGSAIYANGNAGYYYLNVAGLGFSYSIITMSECKFGVYAVTTNCDITNCTMENMMIGIIVYKCKDMGVRIFQNIIYADKIGIDLMYNDFVRNLLVQQCVVFMNWFTGGGGIGINVTDNGSAPSPNKYFIDNRVESSNAYGGVLMTDVNYSQTVQCEVHFYNNVPEFGWKIQGGKENYLACNTVTKDLYFDDSKKCLYCFVETIDPKIRCNVGLGGENAMSFTGNCGAVFLRENVFQDNLFSGLYLSSTGIIGPQNNRVNQWYNSVSSTTAFCDGCPATLSTFKVQNYLPYEPSTIIPSSGWFSNTSNNALLLCGNICYEQLQESNQITPEEQFYLDNGSLGLSDFSDQMDEFVKQKILGKVVQMNAPQLTSQLVDFYNNSIGTDFYANQTIKELFADHYISDLALASLDSNIMNLKNLIPESHEISKQLLDSTLAINERDSLLILQDQKLNALESICIDNTNQILPSNQAEAIQNSNIEQTNSELNSNNTIYSNQKIVNEIYLETIAIGNYLLSPFQIIQLESIANQCPLSGGDAVFQSRGLLSMMNYEMNYNDNDICSASGISFKKDNSLKNSIKLYPNPATETVRLSIKCDENKSYQLKLFDVLGTIVKEVSFNGNNIDQPISLSELANGIYFYTIESNNDKLSGYLIHN